MKSQKLSKAPCDFMMSSYVLHDNLTAWLPLISIQMALQLHFAQRHSLAELSGI